MLGTIINCTAIIIGSLLGLLIGRYYTEEMKEITIRGLGLITIMISIQMALLTVSLVAHDFIVIIFSVVLGGVTGVALKIEDRLESLGQWLQEKTQTSTDKAKFIEGFVTASIIFETGPLAILGAINDGLRGDIGLLLIKSSLDGFVSIAFGASLGIGVIFSTIVVFFYQAPITLAAQFIEPFISEYVENMMNVVGGIIIFGLGLKLLDIKDIKVANLIPAIFWVIPLATLLNIILSAL